MPSFIRIGLSLLAVALVLDALPVAAQVNPYRVQQRYNEAKKGKSIDEWTKKLNDSDPTVRLEAVRSLGDSGQPEAVEYLIQATGDPDEAVKIKAIDYLGKLRATDATQVLVQKLVLRDSEPQVKQRILVALGRMGDAKAAPSIAEFLARDSDPAMCGTAVFALGEIGDADTIPKLDALRQRTADPHLDQLAGEAVAKIKLRLSPSSVAVTVPALVDEDHPAPKQKR
ncbi:MAG: HEAT repeat domain-containing protein [Deltaproteobacteria bacterium]|nr:HEAT repeat domain-containing protein [Deltaproteobacteria bacterium]